MPWHAPPTGMSTRLLERILTCPLPPLHPSILSPSRRSPFPASFTLPLCFAIRGRGCLLDSLSRAFATFLSSSHARTRHILSTLTHISPHTSSSHPPFPLSLISFTGCSRTRPHSPTRALSLLFSLAIVVGPLCRWRNLPSRHLFFSCRRGLTLRSCRRSVVRATQPPPTTSQKAE